VKTPTSQLRFAVRTATGKILTYQTRTQVDKDRTTNGRPGFQNPNSSDSNSKPDQSQKTPFDFMHTLSRRGAMDLFAPWRRIPGNSNALVYVQTGLEMFFFTVTVASWLQKHLHLRTHLWQNAWRSHIRKHKQLYKTHDAHSPTQDTTLAIHGPTHFVDCISEVCVVPRQ
jgi:hypothetical protein